MLFCSMVNIAQVWHTSRPAIAAACQASALGETRLPLIFMEAEAWRKRLLSEVEMAESKVVAIRA